MCVCAFISYLIIYVISISCSSMNNVPFFHRHFSMICVYVCMLEVIRLTSFLIKIRILKFFGVIRRKTIVCVCVCFVVVVLVFVSVRVDRVCIQLEWNCVRSYTEYCVP